ncbi:MAG: IS1595 family transposase [Pseudolysinimonas sp.]
MTTKTLPTTLIEAIVFFSDLNVCTQFVAALRWPEGPVCERCGSVEYSYLSTRRLWKCKACKRQYSVKVGTIFEDSALPLSKWLPAVWLIANSKNGVSSAELARSLGVTQKSAWFMLHRIRLAMKAGSLDKISGTAEVDETYVGGLSKNMHEIDRKTKIKRGAAGHKTAVIGALERGGEVRAEVVGDTTGATLQGFVRDNVETGGVVHTDSARGYIGLRDDYDHSLVDHTLGQYVNGQVHTNGIENFWALLKRSIKGTYISVAPYHLERYVDERVFAFNHRALPDLMRFNLVIRSAPGRRLTYDELTGKA